MTLPPVCRSNSAIHPLQRFLADQFLSNASFQNGSRYSNAGRCTSSNTSRAIVRFSGIRLTCEENHRHPSFSSRNAYTAYIEPRSLPPASIRFLPEVLMTNPSLPSFSIVTPGSIFCSSVLFPTSIAGEVIFSLSLRIGKNAPDIISRNVWSSFAPCISLGEASVPRTMQYSVRPFSTSVRALREEPAISSKHRLVICIKACFEVITSFSCLMYFVFTT